MFSWSVSRQPFLTIDSRGTKIVPILLPLTQALGVNTDRITLRQSVFYRTTTQES